MPASSVCRLCGTGVPIDSHVFPDFFIRGTEFELPKGKSGAPQAHSRLLSTRAGIGGGVKQRGGWEKKLGLREPLLCADCDNNKFSKWEGWFRNFFYGNAPGPIRKRAFGMVHPFFPQVRMTQVEYGPFKLFVLSLVWRASIASGLFFGGVDIGRRHEAQLAGALLAADPGPVDFYPLGILDFRHEGQGLEDFIEEPDIIADVNGYKMCRIFGGGFGFLVYLLDHGQQLAVENLQASPQPSGQLAVAELNGLEKVSGWVRNIVAKGIRPRGMDGP